ncbi:MAG TPA: YggS family pyridoxal phosphate-dependent enzyme [Clostridiales bacterium]|nr:YggS family pyridoxal phosphate-dependent enzyme [Clostridiales bacterium]
MNLIEKNLSRLRASIKDAAERSGRSADAVRLVAVTKTRSAEEINMAIRAGVADAGENRVQELLEKHEAVDQVRWHMIGHLQTNKVKYIIDKVDLIHSVESLSLAQEIQKRAGQAGKQMDVLIQINPAMEESKFGVTADEAEQLAREILHSFPNLKIKGLMSMAPFSDDAEEVRPYFREARQLFDHFAEISHPNMQAEILSMGMSNDYAVAIEEGSNLVRIGSALFGERNL